MDRQLLERMIGAGVLMVALVIIAPAILDGQRDSDIAVYPDSGLGNGQVMRRHTIRLDKEPDSPPVVTQVNGTAPAAPAKTARKPAPAVAAPAPAVRPAPVKVTAAAPTARTKKLPASAAKPSVKPTVKKSPRGSASGWSVQLGSFAQQRNAERLANEVQGRGFKTFVVPLDQSDRTLYRVRVGPRDTRAQASDLAAQLEKAGYKGQVISLQPE